MHKVGKKSNVVFKYYCPFHSYFNITGTINKTRHINEHEPDKGDYNDIISYMWVFVVQLLRLLSICPSVGCAIRKGSRFWRAQTPEFSYIMIFSKLNWIQRKLLMTLLPEKTRRVNLYIWLYKTIYIKIIIINYDVWEKHIF